MQVQPYTLVHEVPGRMRLRLPVLARTDTDSSNLEDWLEDVPGVEAVRINRAARSVVVEHGDGEGVRDAVLARLGRFEPAALPGPSERSLVEAEVAPMVRSALALVLLPFLPPMARRVLTFFTVGATLAKGADTLVREGIKVEVLDAVAVGLAAARGKVFTATTTDFLLSLGEYLERRTEHQSDRLVRRLLRPAPAMAWVERDGELVQVPGDEVREGDRVTVGVGETIPVDGHVLEGVALVNQSAVTGEDVPVRREAPARVISGSVIVDGRIRLEATQVGDDTTTARVSRFIQDSLGRRSGTQRLADELADRRVYVTLGTGALVLALTRDLTRVQSVFLVDYSCALKLGTPVAFKSGMVRAAREGILMKGGTAMEQLADVDTVVFDKTGTLTHSELMVTDVAVLRPGRLSEEELLALVASVEEHASHPVARAVVDAARERDLQHITHGEVDYLVAHGISADVGAGHVVIGSRHYLEEHLEHSFADHDPAIRRFQDAGKTLLYVGDEQGPLGLVALRDTLRPEAGATLARLRELGIERLVMMTGDRRGKAEALGEELGLDRVYAELRPEEKAGVIERLQAEGRKVAFVGDGVNDGPALAVAEVGIALPRGADLARAAADIVLLDDQLGGVAEAREIAVATMRLIRNNFNLAVGVNTGVLAGAVLGWLPPVATAMLHNGTTIGILLNALRGARGLRVAEAEGPEPLPPVAELVAEEA